MREILMVLTSRIEMKSLFEWHKPRLTGWIMEKPSLVQWWPFSASTNWELSAFSPLGDELFYLNHRSYVTKVFLQLFKIDEKISEDLTSSYVIFTMKLIINAAGKILSELIFFIWTAFPMATKSVLLNCISFFLSSISMMSNMLIESLWISNLINTAGSMEKAREL